MLMPFCKHLPSWFTLSKNETEELAIPTPDTPFSAAHVYCMPSSGKTLHISNSDSMKVMLSWVTIFEDTLMLVALEVLLRSEQPDRDQIMVGIGLPYATHTISTVSLTSTSVLLGGWMTTDGGSEIVNKWCFKSGKVVSCWGKSQIRYEQVCTDKLVLEWGDPVTKQEALCSHSQCRGSRMNLIGGDWTAYLPTFIEGRQGILKEGKEYWRKARNIEGRRGKLKQGEEYRRRQGNVRITTLTCA